MVAQIRGDSRIRCCRGGSDRRSTRQVGQPGSHRIHSGTNHFRRTHDRLYDNRVDDHDRHDGDHDYRHGDDNCGGDDNRQRRLWPR